MADFASSVRVASELWLPQLVQEPEMAAFVAAPERATEAADVDDLVHRLVRAELENVPLGRIGAGVKMFPPLGGQIPGGLDAEARDGVARAIGVAVAIGYLGLAGHEWNKDGLGVRHDRTPKQIWDFWLPRINLGFLQKVMHEDNVSFIRRFAGNVFVEQARELGLGGFGKKGKLKRSGAYLGQAGMMLRASQGDWADQDMVINPPPEMGHQWPYEDFLPYEASTP